jgi:hypothetical protein
VKDTTEVYRFVARYGKAQCCLYVSEVPGCPGRFMAAVLYWKREADSSLLSLKTFSMTQNVEEAKREAEAWIRSNLFPDYPPRIRR